VVSLGTVRTIEVTASVPSLLASPPSLGFSAVVGEAPLPAAQSIDLSTVTGDPIGYTTQVSFDGDGTRWLAVPTNGTAPGPLTVAPTTTELAPGRHTASLWIYPTYAAVPTNVTITYDVAASALTASPASVAFTVDAATPPAATTQPLSVGDAGTPLVWTATSSQPWVIVSPASGTTPATPTVSLDLAQLEVLPSGTRSATLTFTYGLGTGRTALERVPVALTLDLPLIATVMPRASISGIGGEVAIGGGDFPVTGSPRVQFGGAKALSTSVTSPTELRAVPPPTLSPGTYAVTVENALGLTRSSARLEVIDAAVHGAAAIASPGAKRGMVYDDVREALYVANAGRIDRHRAAAGWAKAADGSDEVMSGFLQGIALSPDGGTLIDAAGGFWLLDASTLKPCATQPTAFVASTPQVGLEMTYRNQVLFIGMPNVVDVPRLFDLSTRRVSTPPGATYGLDCKLAGSANGGHVAQFGCSSGPAAIQRFDSASGAWTATSAAGEGWFGALDRTGSRLVVFGAHDAGLDAWESRYYRDGALIPGTLPRSYTTPPDGTPPATLAVALSPLGNSRAYTWDGVAVRCFDLDGALDSFGVYPLLFSVTPATAPGANARLVVSADERTAFLAGDANVVVVPLP
jgi:hypothetical protein